MAEATATTDPVTAAADRLQHGQAYLGRICRRTCTLAGMNSSCSQISSPMRSSLVPSCVQIFWLSAMSCMIWTRGKLAASFLRPRLRRSWDGTLIDCACAVAAALTSISLNKRA